ncbi:MAG: hypothetical protein P8J86_00350 [Phycisphaerales bacterium]|nr:hypothetical protein [Phycisphaerales bacterium]
MLLLNGHPDPEVFALPLQLEAQSGAGSSVLIFFLLLQVDVAASSVLALFLLLQPELAASSVLILFLLLQVDAAASSVLALFWLLQQPELAASSVLALLVLLQVEVATSVLALLPLWQQAVWLAEQVPVEAVGEFVETFALAAVSVFVFWHPTVKAATSAAARRLVASLVRMVMGLISCPQVSLVGVGLFRSFCLWI